MTDLPLHTYLAWITLILVFYLIVLVRGLLAETTKTYEFLLIQTEIEALLDYLAVPKDIPAMAAWEREFGLSPSHRTTIRQALDSQNFKSIRATLMQDLPPQRAAQALIRLEEIAWRLNSQEK